LQEAKIQLQKAIALYNEARPHMSISNLTPSQVHKIYNVNHKRLWKNYYKKQTPLENRNENLSCKPITGFII
jgi:putative transposase